MTKQEAIEILNKNAPKSDPRLCALELCSAIHVVTLALQEPERKKERCEYCKDGKSFIGQVVILGNDATWHKINYCPNCGADMRKSEVKKNDYRNQQEL